MNKYEQLIEAILAENQARAKEIFHQIVVEKSRDIYESLMDEEDKEKEELEDEIDADEVSEGFRLTAEEAKSLMDYVDSGLAESVSPDLLGRVAQFYGVGINEGLLQKLEESSDQLLNIAYGEESDMDDMADDGLGGELDMDDDMGGDMDMDAGMDDDMGDDMGDDMDMGGEDLEGRVMDLESALDELKAEFDALMSDEGEEDEGEAEGGDMFGGEEPEADEGEEDEGEEGEGEEDEGEGEEQPMEARSRDSVDVMREYVEKVSAGHGAEKKGAGEGHEVGKGGSAAINKQSIVAGKNDMGGSAANLVKGGTEATPDGDAPKGKAGGFLKAPKEIDVAARNVNKPGGNKGAQNFYGSKASAKKGEESGTNKQSIEPGSK